MSFLVVGDIHIKEDNVDEIQILIKNIQEITTQNKFEHIVLLGDILHHHEKIFTQSLNRALDFIKKCTEITHTYILTGNHDYCLGENVSVLLFNGEVKMSQDIREGDILIDDDGNPCDVISTCKGYDELYTVYYEDGSNYIVSHKHSLTLSYYPKTNGSGIEITKKTSLAILDMKMEDYIKYTPAITQYFYGIKAIFRNCKTFIQKKIDIKSIGLGAYHGFSVNSKSKRFLLGDLTITHNCSNSEFLTENHWLNALKKWPNLTIIDKVHDYGDYLMCPYVYPGRFIEALETKCPDGSWKNKKIIFAHQEFVDCQMGAIKSKDGDKWNIEWPQVISGHIHDTQTIDKIFYPGAPLQHSFGDTDKRIVASINLSDLAIVEYPLNVPKKYIIHTDITNLKSNLLKNYDKNGKKKIKLEATTEEFKIFKESKDYKDLIRQGIKFQLVTTKNEPMKETPKNGNFLEILEKLIDEEKDDQIRELFNKIVLCK
jgi:hypothetical protein